MKKLALGALLAGFLAACGGGGSGDDVVQPIDARADSTTTTDAGDTTDAPVSLVCDPLAPAGSQGCAANEKCTWIRVQTTPTIIGALGCVPDGTVALGGTCTRGPDGQTTGYDTCVAGNICIGPSTGGICQDICGFDGSANAACAAGQACTRYQNTFANAMEDPIAGACNPTCQPITQLRDDNNMPCPAGQGCYTLTSNTETTAVCARGSSLTNGARSAFRHRRRRHDRSAGLRAHRAVAGSDGWLGHRDARPQRRDPRHRLGQRLPAVPRAAPHRPRRDHLGVRRAVPAQRRVAEPQRR